MSVVICDLNGRHSFPGYFTSNILLLKEVMEIFSLPQPSLFHWPSIEQCFRYQICTYNCPHCFRKSLWQREISIFHRLLLNKWTELYVHIWHLKHCSMLGQWNKLGTRRKIFTNYAPVNSQLPKKTLQMADIFASWLFYFKYFSNERVYGKTLSPST